MSELNRIVEAFDLLQSWEHRYQLLEDLGGRLGRVPPEQKNDQTVVHGCASNVWVVGRLEEDTGRLRFEAEAEQPIIRGLVYLMLQIFADKTPDQVMETDIDGTLERLQLDEHLSTQRHIGMYALVRKMKHIALPYSGWEKVPE